MTLARFATVAALAALATRIPPLFGGGNKGKQWNTPPEMTIDLAKAYQRHDHYDRGDFHHRTAPRRGAQDGQ